MTWGLKQTCLPDIHDNTFEGPHWNLSPYGPNTANMGTAVDIYVLTVLSYLERIGVARTGRNLGPDGILDWRVQIVQNNYGSFNSLPVMPATSYLHTQQIPATCVVLQSASQNSSRSNYSILFHVLVSEASSSQSLLCVLALITLMYDDSMLHMCQ